MENGDSDEYLENKTDDDNYYDDEEDGTSYCQEPLAEGDVEELIAELVEIESKAGEAQEALEDEALLRVEADVRNELAQSLPGNELEKAVVEEMSKYKEEWELVLDELEEESTHLPEQLDGAGIELSSLYRWIEKQVSNGCHTEAWKGRTHWVGAQISEEAAKAVSQAEEYLKIHRPVKRWHGASGFLGKKIVKSNDSVAVNNNTDKDWDAFNKLCSQKTSKEDIAFGKMHWASIYQANTPQQAAELGLKFAGVDEVEEISDVDGSSSDLFLADAIANERDLSLTEEQKRKFRKVKEEDDARDDLKLRIHTKQVRRRKRKKEGELISIDEKIKVDVTVISEDDPEDDNNHKELYNKKCELSAEPHNEKAENNYEDEARASEAEVARDIYSLIEEGSEPEVIMFSSSESDSDSDAKINGKVNFLKKVTPGVVSLSSSDSGSDDENANTSTNRKRKKIRRILDDAELGEETKKKIAIEKERQDRLRSLEATESVMVGKSAGVEVPNNSSSGYIINLMREEDEEAVRIPPSISANLKPHQISGVRFMWENIIQSVKKARSGDRGLGCILAHTMGLGKTFQVIAFLYTVMRCADVGLKTALILTPVSVLHNWKHEFQKWRPSELKPLRVFMLGDAPRENRLELLTKWRNKGGIFLIGYAAFRNLSLGKHTKDPFIAKEISRALQVGPDILVCDEAHIIKNTKADITQALMQVKCQRRIALTGSPLQNNLMEYYCMVDFVREGFLGSCHEFRNRFQNPIENGQHTDATSEDVKIMNQRSHILYEQLKGFVHRMGSSILKNDLPPKTVFVIGVKLSTLQRKLYKGFLDIRGFTNKASVDKASFFAAYHILAQILNHPAILLLMQKSKDQTKVEDVEKCVADESSGDENINVMSGAIQTPHIEQSNDLVCEDWWRDLLPENNCREVDYSGKMVLLLDILTICSNMGDKALVFSQNLSTLDLIEYHLSRMPCPEDNSKNWLKGKDWYRLDGRTESSERQKLVERFNEPLNKRVKCVLISTRAGSLGINLYSANRVIIVDGSWNPTHDLQAIYRAWRFGQTKPVFAYRLMAYSTIEEKIYKRQVNKEGLAARVVDRQQVHRTISKEEMLDLFDFVDDESARVSNKHDAMGSIRASSDEVMQSLISRHQPRWISSYHEHETLLQENEDEKLSKEEQDLAWEVYKKTIKTGAAGFVSPNDHHVILQQQNSADPSALGQKQQQSSIDTNDPPSRTTDSRGTCTKHSHLLMLRSQGTKMGCSTICAECDREISLDDLNC